MLRIRSTKSWLLALLTFLAINGTLFLLWKYAVGRIFVSRPSDTYKPLLAVSSHEHTNFPWSQAHSFRQANLSCFQYSNRLEMWSYNKPDLFYACYAQLLCVAPSISEPFFRFSVPYAEPPAQGMPPVLVDRYQIEFFQGAVPYRLLTSDVYTVFMRRFSPWNPYHAFVDIGDPFFEAQLFAPGQPFYNASTDLFERHVRFWSLNGMTKAPFDALILSMFASKEVADFPPNWQPFCVRNAWLGVPYFLRPDMRYEETYPDRNAKPAYARIRYAREVVKQALLLRYPNITTAVARELERRPACTRSREECLEQAITAHTDFERSYGWPLSEVKQGTVISFVPRTRNRVIVNANALVERLKLEFVDKRGYPVYADDLSDIPVADQIIRAARTTVLVGSHGAGLTHLMWMQPNGSSVVELRSHSNSRKFFAMLAVDHHVKYRVHRPMRYDLDALLDDADVNFEVDVDIVIALVTLAVYRSDQAFGVPETCHRPITAQEAARTEFALQSILDQQV